MRSWRPLLILTTLLLLLPSSRFHPYSLHLNLHPQHARGGSSDSSDKDMASYDGDSDYRSDEDEDDGKSPVYATRFSAHGVKQPTLTGDDIAEIYPIMRLRLTSLSQLLH